VLEAFDGSPVIIRTFDLGGDKFPAFLRMPPEENPFLGWRAIRVCLDEPELFRAQLRALLRAAAHGDLRIMLPLVNETREIMETRALLEQEIEMLRGQGQEVRMPQLGVMIETPAAAVSVAGLAKAADFLSIGTNDLVQYTLAVDRGNSRLARLYDPFHPAVLHLLATVMETGRRAGLEVSVCGELAADPMGAFLLIGMGADSLSVGPSSLAEIKKLIRTVHRSEAEKAVAEALSAADSTEVRAALQAHFPADLDLDLFAGSWSLSEPD
jgi:phosphoenolpyruvate-protein phosphotransferase (PTS system enzyme I)